VNIGFVSPLMLWGMLAASLPIIIHLINRRRARKIEFSATYFVRLSNKRLARSLKLKQFLLLLFRTLLLLLLPLLFARPYTIPPATENAVIKNNTPTSIVMVVDQSMSMRANHNGSKLFDLALEKARSLVTSFNSGDSIGLIMSPVQGESDVVELTFEHHTILEMLDKKEPTHSSTDFSKALEKARLMLEGSVFKQRQIVLIGDLTENGYDIPFAVEVEGEAVPMAVFDVRDAESIANYAISSITMERSFFTGSRDWSVSVAVANFSQQPVSALPLSILLNGENVANGFVDIPPGETVGKKFIVKVEDMGQVRLEARIPDDNLLEDNRRFAQLNVARNLNVLLVNGQPSTTRHLDEVFYLKEALNPGGMDRSRIYTRVITPDWFMNEKPDDFDLIFLCQVPKISTEMGVELERFVSEGNGLFITVGPNVDIDNYNETIGDLLPGRLRGERLAGTGTETKQNTRVVYLSHLDYQQPAFSVFDDETAKSLYLAPVKKYLTFDPDASRKKHILARFSDTSPALVQVDYGKGKSILFTSSISRIWNDIPIQPGFLPLMQELAHALAGNVVSDEKRFFMVGESYLVPEELKIKSLISPTGKKIKLISAENNMLISEPLKESGFYNFTGGSNADFIVANVTVNESNLKPISQADKQNVFGASGKMVATTNPALSGGRVECSWHLIWFLMLLFVGEVLVLRWMR